MSDPLEQLFVRTEQVEQEQRQVLAKLVFPYAGINPETGDVYFKPTSDELSAKQKIVLYMLCRLALSALPNTTFSNIVSPKEVEKGINIPGGTIRPQLSRLVDEKTIIKTGEGYCIPAAFLHRAQAIMPTPDA